MIHDPFNEPDDDVEWLREMVDEDLQGLFTEEESSIESAVRHFIPLAIEDAGVERRLLEVVETALDLGNDDTNGSVWATVILGEARSRNAVPLLLRSLSSEADEMLQDAAAVALLRIGTPAMAALMEAIDEEENPLLHSPGYQLLGAAGLIDDELLLQRVRDFFETRLELERREPASRNSLEKLCQAVARVGDRSQAGTIRRILMERYEGSNPVVEDSLAMLEDNPDGRPFVPSVMPWEERYGWLFDDERDGARVERPPAE